MKRKEFVIGVKYGVVVAFNWDMEEFRKKLEKLSLGEEGEGKDWYFVFGRDGNESEGGFCEGVVVYDKEKKKVIKELLKEY